MWSAGPVQFNLSTLLEWMAGLYRFFLLWLCCNGYGTVEMVGGWSVFFSIFSLLFIFGGRLCVVGLHFLKLVLFGSILVFLVDFVFYKLLIFFLICYRWYRQSRNLEDQEPLLEQTRLEHRKLDIETRIEELESDVRNLKDNHVMLEDGDKKEAIFSEICGLDSQIFQLKAELATVNSLLSSYN